MTETELEYQFCFNCNDRKNCYTKPKDCTRIKEEIGLQEMTNEEWFCGLMTEEKAEFSMRVLKNCAWCLDGGSPQECPFNEFSEHCPAESKENMVKWLKEKHTE